MGAGECERLLRPEFQSRGVNSWDLHPSEMCAGGEEGIDTCEGEGGAPLVCLDEVRTKKLLIQAKSVGVFIV